MTDSPEQIALQALAALGETPGPDPVAQLRQLVAALKRQVDEISDRMMHENIPPDPDAWGALRNRHLTALAAAAEAEHAAGTAAIDELVGEYGTTGDEDDR
jgi:hypothetical protein